MVSAGERLCQCHPGAAVCVRWVTVAVAGPLLQGGLRRGCGPDLLRVFLASAWPHPIRQQDASACRTGASTMPPYLGLLNDGRYEPEPAWHGLTRRSRVTLLRSCWSEAVVARSGAAAFLGKDLINA